MKKLYIFFFLYSSLLFSQNERGYIVSVGEESPNFIIDQKKSSDLFKNKVVMLQFTASWCSVCIREMPHIEEKIWQLHEDNDNFILLGK